MRLEKYVQLAENELFTVADLRRWGSSRFAAADLDFSQGQQNPRAEADLILARALHLEPEDLADFSGARLLPEEKRRVLQHFYAREILRRPAAYITGEAWFAGLRFMVDERVLIPRSLIEPFIEEGFAPWVEESRIQRILEIGTGSGCMAITLALRFPYAEIDAVDISLEALNVARSNVQKYGLEDQVHLYQSDLFSALQGQRYDLVISNPPYVDAAAMAELPPEYTHEPRLALAAGTDGLDCLLPLLEQAPRHLEAGGVLIVETGDAEVALSEQRPDLPLIWLEHPAGGSGVFLMTFNG
ncbi:50S ribosomal protein L3 N(5)-glutamine methyltransferase [Acidithiobacillus thiooxidans]|uniref:Ribosomal protein L3 N(5)-glutamine methyltransferase n=2 Tax=Acidithiobacillus thiooxidans TaxID=930 RepID=A0A1C2JK27_ACITH|nr:MULTISPECIES: 50S ribosomal protein L3 N(5)-glutamine methyltransferase [Acidithiobacillus]MBE7565259.1 50S ribosomal protein L3 N(5)-glutamine methyltransferase [Acidithiobacillus sp. HP-11]MBU2742011.1 50S ribosomal protein L3 N(5)-glutamine methyltransferase [Acidithiobacillus albertensis]MBU2751463.1 50S ribosomal protein L3 N(5)-glutamine methyltransferase [Acidithiobacillus thiooxidans]MBU2793516.1 50S ribosomal protein L3 N(5)-glutamine methyltransferase [Acidithiobacillus thiooxidans